MNPATTLTYTSTPITHVDLAFYALFFGGVLGLMALCFWWNDRRPKKTQSRPAATLEPHTPYYLLAPTADDHEDFDQSAFFDFIEVLAQVHPDFQHWAFKIRFLSRGDQDYLHHEYWTLAQHHMVHPLVVVDKDFETLYLDIVRVTQRYFEEIAPKYKIA